MCLVKEKAFNDFLTAKEILKNVPLGHEISLSQIPRYGK